MGNTNWVMAVTVLPDGQRAVLGGDEVHPLETI